VREFYSGLTRPARVGIEATGSMQWFVDLMEEPGIECLLSGDLVTYERTSRPAGLIAAPPPVGASAGQNTKMRDEVSLCGRKQPTGNRVFAVVATCRLSADRVAGNVWELTGAQQLVLVSSPLRGFMHKIFGLQK